ncbi:hypothetical protein KBZ94_38155 [Streptomyces sp. RM72]|uniref:hypothetical protein n=1 Tax=Streptomyces sp. RM72 TaxID=1115510 RepID=UPI001B397757|nr:hypothetical protein [Streptomyces sp. RM72]MBQ0890677.1 hypothetical protein [Streptomyces sp. RM72]
MDTSATGFFVSAEGERIRVVWTQNGGLTLPRASTALDTTQGARRDTGPTGVRRNRYRVSAAALVSTEPQCTARMLRVGPLDAAGAEVGRSYAGHQAAVGALARRCGLPMPLTLIDGERRP